MTYVGIYEGKLKKMKYASEFKELEYLTDDIKNINKKKLLFLYNSVDRAKAINKFANVLKNIDIAIDIEAGLFEFTLVYALTKNIEKNLLPCIYLDKLEDLLLNLDTNSYLSNKVLKSATINKEIIAQKIAFMTPQELNPEDWKIYVEKRKVREEKKKNKATTDLYQCFKCGEKKCIINQMQTRSADEPMTKFITCLVCYNTFKK